MSKQKTGYILSIFALAVVIFGLAWAEQITLTTYYPAPYGVYKEFTTTSKTILATEPSANVGIGIDTPAEKLDVTGIIHATEDVCIDTGTEPLCLSSTGGGSGGGWQYYEIKIKSNQSPPPIWQTINLSAYGVTGRALVLLRVENTSGDVSFAVRPKGDPHKYVDDSEGGTALILLNDSEGSRAGTLAIVTDTSGAIEWKKSNYYGGRVDMWLLGFINEAD